MKNNFKYLERDERKKILLLCDDIRLHSGVGNMGKEIVLNTAQHFNWVNVGGAIKHKDKGKIIELSEEVNKLTGLEDSSVKIIPTDNYGDAMLIRHLIDTEKPDAVFIFTDPRYWVWLFEIEREVRSKIPIVYLNIWDDYPAPLYNKPYYESVDLLMAISKQTKNINEIVLDDKADTKLIEYIPHGVDEEIFYPLDETSEMYEEFTGFRNKLFPDKDIEFVLFFNSRNIRRKNIPDTILAYRLFCDKIGKEKAKKCAFILHTQPVDNNGTDLFAVKEALCDPEYVNIYFSSDVLSPEQLNLLYNVADATILLTSNEGWGLSLTESLSTGTMIIPTVTGGMQDQCRFENSNGEWIDFSPDFPSNHRGNIKKCGNWAVPVFPVVNTLQGSPPTPYIFDDKIKPEDAAEAILEVYNLSPEERKERGLNGRNWAQSEEAGLTSKLMGNRVIEAIDKTLEVFTPRPDYEVIKVQPLPPKYIKHRLVDYSYE